MENTIALILQAMLFSFLFTLYLLSDRRTNTVASEFDSRISRLERACLTPINIVPDGHVESADERTDTFSESDELSINEKILLREKEFDARISAFKAGEIIRYDVRKQRPEDALREARSLHPDVKNLPHDVIDLKLKSLPDVEIPE